MNTWMIYGPFDLSDAVSGYFDFFYWTQEEIGYDGFFYGVSPDGINFYGYLGRFRQRLDVHQR